MKEDILPGRDSKYSNSPIQVSAKKNAVPCMFLNLPFYLSKRNSSTPRSSL